MTVPPSPMRHRQPSDDGMTRVELTWIEKRIEHWIRFGRVAVDEIVDRRRRIVRFRPGAIFAFVRWAANDYGTVVSRIDIVRAVGADEPLTTLPFVRPGGDILLKIDGWPKVERVLQIVDAIEAQGIDPAEVSPDHWRHVHNRLAARCARRRALERPGQAEESLVALGSGCIAFVGDVVRMAREPVDRENRRTQALRHQP